MQICIYALTKLFINFLGTKVRAFSVMVYKMLLSVRYTIVALSLFYFTIFAFTVIIFHGKCSTNLRILKNQSIFKDDGIASTDAIQLPPNLESTYIQRFQNFPWGDYKNSLVQVDQMDKTRQFTQQLLLETVQFLQKAPSATTPNQFCHSPPLKFPNSLVCNKLPKLRRVGMLLQFDYNVDALEVHLHELHELIDKVFIIESSRQINSYLKSKPLLWDRLKYDKRFIKFAHKIVHFIVDDSEFMHVEGSQSKANGVIYSNELLLERLRWMKFLQWNAATNYFGPEDLIGFGTVSEIPDRNNVFSLKACRFYSISVDIGIWTPVGEIDTISQTDFPVKGHPYTFASPTFWTVQAAKRNFRGTNKSRPSTPTQMRGKSPAFLLGGMDMSYLLNFPNAVAKFLATFNLQREALRRFIEIGLSYSIGDIDDVEVKSRMRGLLMRVSTTSQFKEMSINEFKKNSTNDSKQIVKIPWLIACNPKRYSYMITNENEEKIRDFVHHHSG